MERHAYPEPSCTSPLVSKEYASGTCGRQCAGVLGYEHECVTCAPRFDVMAPGATIMARMLKGRSSTRRASVRLCTAALEEE